MMGRLKSRLLLKGLELLVCDVQALPGELHRFAERKINHFIPCDSSDETS